MRELFESGKITQVILFEELNHHVKINMQPNKCFEIRKYDAHLRYWKLCFETSSICEWEKALNLAKSLIK